MEQGLELEQVRLNRTPQLKVIMDVETRWNSSLAMLRRIVELKVPMAAVRTALRQMPDEQKNLATLNDIYLGNNERRTADLITNALSVFEDATLLFSSSDYGLAASMFPWMTMLLFAMEVNHSGIEEVETLRNNLQLEIGSRVRELDILVKASFFHPTSNLLYKQCYEEKFDVLKDLLRKRDAGYRATHQRPCPTSRRETNNYSQIGRGDATALWHAKRRSQ
ncbi:hypothetical protein BG015_002829 [Linnemannia schmuckeri]|uniref:Uncharacterized protein n=1 Tax=Linnemannia schmuckeri TaxID=64567 RepID=A0A9P5S6C7_9FUNG|nr:hypothetical protein BG015_002829 [Linnemannia schmuckeri]